jgi:hypothetical protein
MYAYLKKLETEAGRPLTGKEKFLAMTSFYMDTHAALLAACQAARNHLAHAPTSESGYGEEPIRAMEKRMAVLDRLDAAIAAAKGEAE